MNPSCQNKTLFPRRMLCVRYSQWALFCLGCCGYGKATAYLTYHSYSDVEGKTTKLQVRSTLRGWGQTIKHVSLVENLVGWGVNLPSGSGVGGSAPWIRRTLPLLPTAESSPSAVAVDSDSSGDTPLHPTHPRTQEGRTSPSPQDVWRDTLLPSPN